MTDKSKILVIKLGALGDFIQALGPMAAIRRHHENAQITLLTTKPYVNLAEQSGYFDEIWIDERPKWYQPRKWLALKKKLDKSRFVRVYDLQNNDRTSLYLRLFGQKPEWVGAAKGASHRNNAPERTTGLAFYGHVQTLSIGGIDNVGIDTLDWIKADKEKFGLKAPYVLLVPGSSPKHTAKRWPGNYYGEIAKLLHDSGFQPVILGTEEDADPANIIKDICPQSFDLTGTTDLTDVAVLARDAHAVLGNDTGPMHMIAPTGCPTLMLFSGASNPVRHAPLGANVKTYQTENLEDLPVEDVWTILRDLLEAYGSDLTSTSAGE